MSCSVQTTRLPSLAKPARDAEERVSATQCRWMISAFWIHASSSIRIPITSMEKWVVEMEVRFFLKKRRTTFLRLSLTAAVRTKEWMRSSACSASSAKIRLSIFRAKRLSCRLWVARPAPPLWISEHIWTTFILDPSFYALASIKRESGLRTLPCSSASR